MTGLSGPVHSADLVIVGAGGAGLTAAAAALECGLSDIVVLDKASSPGGNTAQSAGMFAIGSPAQKRKGIATSAGDIFREKMEYANWRVDPRLTRVCIEKSGEIVDARVDEVGKHASDAKRIKLNDGTYHIAVRVKPEEEGIDEPVEATD